METVDADRVLSRVETVFWSHKRTNPGLVRLSLEEIFAPMLGEHVAAFETAAAFGRQGGRLRADPFTEGLYEERSAEPAALPVTAVQDPGAGGKKRGFFSVSSAWKAYRVRLLQQAYFRNFLDIVGGERIGQVFYLGRFLETEFRKEQLVQRWNTEEAANAPLRRETMRTKFERSMLDAVATLHTSMIDHPAVTAATEVGAMLAHRQKEEAAIGRRKQPAFSQSGSGAKGFLGSFVRRLAKAVIVSTLVGDPALYSTSETDGFRAGHATYAGRTDRGADTRERWLLSMLDGYSNTLDQWRHAQTEIAHFHSTVADRERGLTHALALHESGSASPGAGAIAEEPVSQQRSLQNPRASLWLDGNELVFSREGVGLSLRRVEHHQQHSLRFRRAPSSAGPAQPRQADAARSAAREDFHESRSASVASTVFRLEELQVAEEDATGRQERPKALPSTSHWLRATKRRVMEEGPSAVDTEEILISEWQLLRPGAPLLRARDGHLGFLKKIVPAAEVAQSPPARHRFPGIVPALLWQRREPDAEAEGERVKADEASPPEPDLTRFPTLYEVEFAPGGKALPREDGESETKSTVIQQLTRSEILPVISHSKALFLGDSGQSIGLPLALAEEWALQRELAAQPSDTKPCDALPALWDPVASAGPDGGYRSQRLLRKLHKMAHSGDGRSALAELRHRLCLQLENTLQFGMDSADLHQRLVLRSADNRLSSARSSLGGQPTSMTRRDDALLDQLQAYGHRDLDADVDVTQHVRLYREAALLRMS